MMLRSAAVLGAGTMGAQIAAHFANARVPTLLLDLTPDVARHGLGRAKALKPDPFFTPDALNLLTIGDSDRPLSRPPDVDAIVDAPVEQLPVTRAPRARPDADRRSR